MLRTLSAIIVCLMLASCSVQIEGEDVEPVGGDPSQPIEIKYPTAARYSIADGKLGDRLGGKAHFYHKVIWAHMKELLDIFEVGNLVSTFAIDVEDSRRAAHVALIAGSTTTQDERWELGVNWHHDQDFLQAYPTNLHEMLHLRVRAIDVDDVTGCPEAYRSNEVHDTYLVPFVREFWRHCFGVNPKPRYVAADFVTEYAATNINEDLAESGKAYLICGDRHTHKGRAKDKIAFFAQIPEMQSIRTKLAAKYNRDFLEWARDAEPHTCDPE